MYFIFVKKQGNRPDRLKQAAGEICFLLVPGL
ncbi:hypothetical protein FHS19_005473 [Paenibacillus rhizosphaerae]|uniref:Uncharacterized protein n=1 Tax=Paenibacillus rhizosphaerae TaxID=297318 RepID=A0A839TUE1_9BACL|nr:hypothetical protein [Paenibacillus rhizosphaerae]